MRHECKITVIDKKCFADYQEKYLADPKSGPCPFFNVGDEFILKRTPQQDDFYHLMNGKFCGEAWDAVSRYVYTALQGGSIMKGWTNDDRVMIACCNAYETPNATQEYAWGRYYFTDKQAFCSPILSDSNNFISFEEDSNHITFRCRCDNCGKRYSKHYHEQFTEKEWQEKQRLDSIFYDRTIPDHPY